MYYKIPIAGNYPHGAGEGETLRQPHGEQFKVNYNANVLFGVKLAAASSTACAVHNGAFSISLLTVAPPPATTQPGRY